MIEMPCGAEIRLEKEIMVNIMESPLKEYFPTFIENFCRLFEEYILCLRSHQ